jgi:hypothetical protein
MKNPGKIIPPVSYDQIKHTKIIETRTKIVDMLNADYADSIAFMEIGTGSGDFANEIITNARVGRATILDIFNGYSDVHNRHLPQDQEKFVRERFLLNKNVVIIKGSSHKALPELYKHDNTKYDFIYLDADHSMQQVSTDLSWATKMIKDDGIIGIDDFCFKPGFLEDMGDKYEAQEAVMTFLKNNLNWKIKYFSFNDGGFQNIFISKQW